MGFYIFIKSASGLLKAFSGFSDKDGKPLFSADFSKAESFYCYEHCKDYADVFLSSYDLNLIFMEIVDMDF